MFVGTFVTVQIKSVSTQILLQKKLSGAFKYRKKRLAAGTPPQTSLGSLQRSPDPLDGGRGWLPLPKIPPPVSAISSTVLRPC